jgi:hypothetical protein
MRKGPFRKRAERRIDMAIGSIKVHQMCGDGQRWDWPRFDKIEEKLVELNYVVRLYVGKSALIVLLLRT